MKTRCLFQTILVFTLLISPLSAKEKIHFWGTPEWNKKVRSFKLSPREAEKCLFCALQEGRKSTDDLAAITDLFLLCICDDEYVFTRFWPSTKPISMNGFYVNGNTGFVRIIFYLPSNPDQYPKVEVFNRYDDNQGLPFPLEAFCFRNLTKKEWYQLVKEACPTIPRDELKKWADKEWKKFQKDREAREELNQILQKAKENDS